MFFIKNKTVDGYDIAVAVAEGSIPTDQRPIRELLPQHAAVFGQRRQPIVGQQPTVPAIAQLQRRCCGLPTRLDQQRHFLLQPAAVSSRTSAQLLRRKDHLPSCLPRLTQYRHPGPSGRPQGDFLSTFIDIVQQGD